MIEADGWETVYATGVRALREETDAEFRARIKAGLERLGVKPPLQVEIGVATHVRIFPETRGLVPVDPILIIGTPGPADLLRRRLGLPDDFPVRVEEAARDWPVIRERVLQGEWHDGNILGGVRQRGPEDDVPAGGVGRPGYRGPFK